MEKAWGGGWGRGGPGEVYGRRSGGRGWGPVFWVPVLALVSPGTAGGGRVPRGCRQTAAHVAGGGGRGEAHQHGTPVHCRVSCCQWRGSNPLGDPQEDHVRAAPQTPPFQLGPSPPTVPRPLPSTGHSEPPSAGPFHSSTALTRVIGLPSGPVPFWDVHSYAQHPPSPPGLFHQEIRVGAPGRRPSFHRGD